MVGLAGLPLEEVEVPGGGVVVDSLGEQRDQLGAGQGGHLCSSDYCSLEWWEENLLR